VEFSGTFEIEGVTPEEVWLALSDPVLIKQSLPGCQFLTEVDDPDVDFEELRDRVDADADDPPVLPEADPDDVAARAFEEGEHYAAVMELGVGNVKPTFESVVTIDHREFPRMEASGEGSAANSSFELEAWMELAETDDGVAVEWQAEPDVFGRVAQMGQRVLNPVANRVVNRFFSSVEERLTSVNEEEDAGLRERISDLV